MYYLFQYKCRIIFPCTVDSPVAQLYDEKSPIKCLFIQSAPHIELLNCLLQGVITLRIHSEYKYCIYYIIHY